MAIRDAQIKDPMMPTKGAGLPILEPAIDMAGPMGTMVLTVLGMVSELELSFIK